MMSETHQLMKICYFVSVHDFKLAAPDRFEECGEDFERHKTSVDVRIKQLQRNGIKVQKVVVRANQFFDWIKRSSKEIRKMSLAQQRAKYAQDYKF